MNKKSTAKDLRQNQKPSAGSSKPMAAGNSNKPLPKNPGVLSKWLAYFENCNPLPRESVLEGLINSSDPNFDFFIMVILSCAIATFGLITNSAAVIIGAMLIAPLMSPILGLSMASISGLGNFFERSLITILESFALAVGLSSLLAFLSYKLPLGALAALSSEALARTSPSLLDLLIALSGGAAAAYAFTHPRLSEALPGVAISTALMPPICTIGIGIALAQTTTIFGALLLFITNLTAISFSAMITFALMGYSSSQDIDSKKVKQSVSISLIMVLAISIPLGLFALNSLKGARIYNLASSAIVESASAYSNVILVDLKITNEGSVSKLVATLRTSKELTPAEVSALQGHVADRLQKPVALELVTIPMQILAPQKPATPAPTSTPTQAGSAAPTLTPTLTPVPTSTPMPTATPFPAFIKASSGANVYDMPNGSIIFHLPVNAAIRVNVKSVKTINKITWIEVKDTFERSGWVELAKLDIPLDAITLP